MFESQTKGGWVGLGEAVLTNPPQQQASIAPNFVLETHLAVLKLKVVLEGAAGAETSELWPWATLPKWDPRLGSGPFYMETSQNQW